ncbi:MAG: hypothetical protein JSR53_16615 [Proteobacteria bacterium]|nr:hypothetical protein [Pseudomonadota bacterium]
MWFDPQTLLARSYPPAVSAVPAVFDDGHGAKTAEPQKPQPPTACGLHPKVAESQKSQHAANDPAPDRARWCWLHSSAWNTSEIELFNRRAALFVRRGADDAVAERLADRLVQRDREADDMRTCMECRHLQGNAPWRCGNWQVAGVAIRAGDAGLARELATTMQRCPGFAAAALPATVPPFVAAPVDPQAAPERVQPQGPDRSPAAPWRELDRAYLAHHAECTACQCAGRGYGRRCDVGAPLWAAYLAESSI